MPRVIHCSPACDGHFMRPFHSEPAIDARCRAEMFLGTFINLNLKKEGTMSNSVYKVIELVGTSDKSWEDAAKNAVETASRSLKELRIAEVSKLDMKVEVGKVVAYRARVKLSFKYEAS
jgi:dodecin